MASIQILIVEDNAELLDTLVEISRALGHQVDGCRSAEEAENLLSIKRYNLLLTDYTLTDFSGLDLANRAVHIDGMRVVVMSGMCGPDNLPMTISWLKKPFDFAAFARICSQAEQVPQPH